MIATTIIVLREFLEISLILGMLYALLKEVKNRKNIISYGLFLGIMLSLAIAAGFYKISNSFSGHGQEILNIIILFFSIICMFITILTIKSQTIRLKEKIILSKNSNLPLSIIILTALTISREGAELTLFLYSLSISGVNLIELFEGLVLGAIIAFSVSILMYYGLLRLPTKYLFNSINILLSIFAASMAAELANYISAVGIGENLSNELWNISWLVSENSFMGKTLKILIGYNPRPSQLQVIFYFTTLTLMLITISKKNKHSNKSST